MIWEANKNCGSSYSDLFSPKGQEQYVMRPFLYDTHDLPLESIRSEFSCELRFDQSNWEHFHMFKDRALFDLMNKNCDTIFMVRYISTITPLFTSIYLSSLM